MLNPVALPNDPRQNQLLAALSPGDWSRVRPYLEPMDLSVGQILSESGSPRTHAYFPTSSIISLVYATSDGTSTEIASVGNEGLAGVTLIMGAAATPLRTIVHCRGEAYRLRAQILTAEFSRGADLHQLLLRYTRARLILTGQLAVCNQRHSIDQQLCRWLLLRLDRLASEELTMTHEALANTLGVRREGITEAALKLQSAGLIRYSRGRITVIDRPGLEACCCECYGVVRRAFDRLSAASPRKSSSFSSVIEGSLSAPHDRQDRTHAAWVV
jgi:CRP-like cAMP-binding protein